MTEGIRTAILYARVSTREQAEGGYSLRHQIGALREWCAREGYEVLKEVEDPGYTGIDLARPGMDFVRDLVAAGGVSIVMAHERDRFAREPAYHYLLKREFEQRGTRMRALNDSGDGTPEGEFMDGVLDQLARLERAKIAERTRRGLDQKVAEGRVVRGRQRPYGFRYSGDGETLLVSEPQMRVVRRIFRQVGAEGLSMGEVMRRLRGDDIPSAMGGRWPRSTIRYLLLNELYLPRLPAELEGLIPAHLLAGLDPAREYGLWTWNKTKQTRWRERSAGGAYRNRVKNEDRPREEWSCVPVDLTGSGLSRAHADAARERLAQNGGRRPASTRERRFWLLSSGMARCAHCGNALTPHTLHQRGKIRYYYRCYTRFNHGRDACDNGRSTAAAPLEDAVWRAVHRLCSDPEMVMRQYDVFVERRSAALRDGGTLAREEQQIAADLRKLLARRSNLIDMGADGTISREDLRVKLAEADGRREGLEKALADARSRIEEV
ncbi:MAG: recombinase family protein, partial [Actinomycetota bacterium]|nr:recombinase family protein [Actinomycetota bacterium]